MSQTGEMIIQMKMSGGVVHRQSMKCHQIMNAIATSQLEDSVCGYVIYFAQIDLFCKNITSAPYSMRYSYSIKPTVHSIRYVFQVTKTRVTFCLNLMHFKFNPFRQKIAQ